MRDIAQGKRFSPSQSSELSDSSTSTSKCHSRDSLTKGTSTTNKSDSKKEKCASQKSNISTTHKILQIAGKRTSCSNGQGSSYRKPGDFVSSTNIGNDELDGSTYKIQWEL